MKVGPGATANTVRVRYLAPQLSHGGCPFMTEFELSDADYTSARSAFTAKTDEASKKVEDLKKQLGTKWNEITARRPMSDLSHLSAEQERRPEAFSFFGLRHDHQNDGIRSASAALHAAPVARLFDAPLPQAAVPGFAATILLRVVLSTRRRSACHRHIDEYVKSRDSIPSQDRQDHVRVRDLARDGRAGHCHRCNDDIPKTFMATLSAGDTGKFLPSERQRK